MIRGGVSMVRIKVLLALLILSAFLQACTYPVVQQVRVDCSAQARSPGEGTSDGGPGTLCTPKTVPVNTLVPANAVVIDSSNNPTGAKLLAGARCTWKEGQNIICAKPGEHVCVYPSGATCHTSYNIQTGRCDCGCFK